LKLLTNVLLLSVLSVTDVSMLDRKFALLLIAILVSSLKN
jgi:hypothetical protein